MLIEHSIKSEDETIKIYYETVAYVDDWKSGIIKINSVKSEVSND